MVPLVLPAVLVFSHLAPDAGRSTAFGIVASLPLPHSPAALCFRPIIPLPDDPGALFVLFSRRPRGLHSRGDLPLAPDCSGKEVRKNPSRIRALKATRRNASPHERTDTGELRSLSRSALPAGESSPFASEVEIHPIHTCP